MKIEYKLNKSEIDTIHSVMGEVTDKWDYTNEEINTFWDILPSDIKLDAIKWVANDIITEETDTLVANSLEWKQVARECSNRVRQYYFTKLDKV